MKLVPLYGETIALYPLTHAHIEAYLSAFSPLIMSYLHVTDSSSERAYLIDRIERQAFFYVMITFSDQRLVGAIEIRDPVYRSQLYCWINENFWAKGYFMQALSLATNHYFGITGENSITARVDCNNARSYKSLSKYGFKEHKKIPGAYGPQYELLLDRKSV